jgi:hypothetical protein
MVCPEEEEIGKRIFRKGGFHGLEPRDEEFFMFDAELLGSHTVTIMDTELLSSASARWDRTSSERTGFMIY